MKNLKCLEKEIPEQRLACDLVYGDRPWDERREGGCVPDIFELSKFEIFSRKVTASDATADSYD